jgi:hypothetical protein
MPLMAATIELDEGARIIDNLIESEPRSCKIARRVELCMGYAERRDAVSGLPYRG